MDRAREVRDILAGADGTNTGRQAADWAAQRAEERGLRLHLVKAVPESSYFRNPAQYAEVVKQAETVLSRERARVSARHPSLEIFTEWRPGEPAAVLSQLSADADMVVVGSDGPADSRGERFGSVSFQAAVLCQSPVAVIPDGGGAGRSGVVAGFDGSADSRVALGVAAEEADRMDMVLTVLHASPSPSSAGPIEGGGGDSATVEPGKLLSAAARGIRDLYPGLTVQETVVPEASPADALVQAAGHARLLVIGRRGRGGLRKPVGSVAEKVLERLPSPTIITRPPSSQAS
jgi:nucleotide-binding universal stress UspA family protein